MRYAVEIPGGLSWLAERDPNGLVAGLEEFPRELWPPVAIVRSAFQIMVAIGLLLLGLSLWFAWSWWRRRDFPSSKLFLGGAVLAGFAAPAAVEAGWIVTEVGRQPWIVYGLMRVEDAVTRAPNVRLGYYAVIVIYSLLTAASVYVLRLLASQPLAGRPRSQTASGGPRRERRSVGATREEPS